MEPGLIIASAAGVAGLGIGLGTAVRLIPVYAGARGELKDFDDSSRAAVYDDIEMLERERRHLCRHTRRLVSYRRNLSTRHEHPHTPE